MTGLSPQTQAVLDAFSKDNGGVYLEDDPERLSFAIRELADQLINVKWSVEMQNLHHEFHIIATELEAL